MISMKIISHSCFLVSLLFFVVSGVVFFTMDVQRGWKILLGRPMKYTKEQRQQHKLRRKEIKRKAAKTETTVELTRKIQTENRGSDATTVLGSQYEEEETTILTQKQEESEFRIIFEITHCSVSE